MAFVFKFDFDDDLLRLLDDNGFCKWTAAASLLIVLLLFWFIDWISEYSCVICVESLSARNWTPGNVPLVVSLLLSEGRNEKFGWSVLGTFAVVEELFSLLFGKLEIEAKNFKMEFL